MKAELRTGLGGETSMAETPLQAGQRASSEAQYWATPPSLRHYVEAAPELEEGTLQEYISVKKSDSRFPGGQR